MSDYSQITFFTPKDSLSTGNPNKIIYGSDVDAEFSAISTAIATKADVDGDAIGAGTPATEVNVDNLKLDGNKITSTNTDGDIELEPNGTGTVVITNVDVAAGEIDGTAIGANSASTGAFTTLQASTSLNVDGTVTADGLTVDGSFETNGDIEIEYAGQNTDPSGARYFILNNTDTTLVAGQPLGGLSWVNNDASATAGEAAYVKAYASTNTGRAELRFGTGDQNGAAEAMRIDANGNVGIGTTSPSAIIEARGDQNDLAVGVFGANNTNNQLTLGSFDATNTNGIPSLLGTSDFGGIIQGSTNGNLVLGIRDNDATDGVVIISGGGDFMTDSTYDTAIATFKADGKVGLGTQSPDAQLDIENATEARLRLTHTPSNFWEIKNDSNLKFDRGGTEYMRIDSSGNTTFSGSGYFKHVGTYSRTTASAANLFIFTDGQFYRSTSSARYKNSIEDAPYGLSDVMALRPVTYKGNNDGDTVYGGLVAEEVHDAGLTQFVQYDEEGRPDALAYGNMVSLCIKAIQEQQEIINDLRARVAQLEGA